MRLASIALLLPLAIATTAAAADSPTGYPSSSKPIATRQTAFSIPYSIEQIHLASAGQIEVQLLVSSDNGRSQRIADSQLVSMAQQRDARSGSIRRNFIFQAPTEGEYWFWLRTIDRSQAAQPHVPREPGLRVVVDTTPPTLKLQAQRDQAGQIIAHWQVNEPLVSREALTVRYRTSSGGQWQPVALMGRDIVPGQPSPRGQAAWWPQAGSEWIQIQAEVVDAAGNLAVSQTEITRDGGTNEPPRNQPWSDPNTGSRPPRVAGRPSTQWPVDRAGSPSTTWPADTSGTSPSWNTSPSEESSPAITGHQTGPGTHPSPPMNTNPPTGTAYGVGTAGTGLQGNHYLPGNSIPATAGPPFADRYVPGGGISDSGVGMAGLSDSLPPGTNPKVVNAQLFDVEYDDSRLAGAVGMGRVEFFATRDGGKTWQSYALDDDNRSPMMVRVQQEGVYGVQIVVQDSQGAGDRPPRSGERPVDWIVVDLTKPAAELTSIDRGPDAGSLIIRYRASDPMLAARPVSLFYRDGFGGEWIPIATGLQNTGSHLWTTRQRLPNGFYVRLTVSDSAGNVGICETPDMVRIEPVRSSGRIGTVRPVSQHAAGWNPVLR